MPKSRHSGKKHRKYDPLKGHANCVEVFVEATHANGDIDLRFSKPHGAQVGNVFDYKGKPHDVVEIDTPFAFTIRPWSKAETLKMHAGATVTAARNLIKSVIPGR